MSCSRLCMHTHGHMHQNIYLHVPHTTHMHVHASTHGTHTHKKKNYTQPLPKSSEKDAHHQLRSPLHTLALVASFESCYSLACRQTRSYQGTGW